MSAATELEKSGITSPFIPLHTRVSMQKSRLRASLGHHAKPLKQERGSTRGRGCGYGGPVSQAAIVWQRSSEERHCGRSRDSQDCPERICGGSVFKDLGAVTVAGRGDTCRCLAGCQDSRIVVAGASHGCLMFLSAWLKLNQWL